MKSNISTEKLMEAMRDYSRDSLRVLRYMVYHYPSKKVFFSSEFESVLKKEGKSLGGVMGSFSKRKNIPLVIKLGYVITNWEGKVVKKRAEPVWAINPKLDPRVIMDIRNILVHDFYLDEPM
ncbi:MAG: hypothetical protein V1846_03355 [Candidatus Komeilibacteria bacterium]